jgi:hypothetical protein
MEVLDVNMERLNITVKNVKALEFANIINENRDVLNVVVVLFVNTEDKNIVVMKVIVMEVEYANTEEESLIVMKVIVMEVLSANMEIGKMHVINVVLNIFVFIVNTHQEKKDTLNPLIKKSNVVLDASITITPMMKFQEDIKKNSIILMKN